MSDEQNDARYDLEIWREDMVRHKTEWVGLTWEQACARLDAITGVAEADWSWLVIVDVSGERVGGGQNTAEGL